MSFESVFSDEEIYKIGKYLVEHGAWHRHEQDREDESYSILGIKLPYDANLSSNGSRVDAVNRKIKEANDE